LSRRLSHACIRTVPSGTSLRTAQYTRLNKLSRKAPL